MNPQEEYAARTAPFYTLQKSNRFFLPFSFYRKGKNLSSGYRYTGYPNGSFGSASMIFSKTLECRLCFKNCSSSIFSCFLLAESDLMLSLEDLKMIDSLMIDDSARRGCW